MTDFIPSTEAVREAYVESDFPGWGKEFDAWLAREKAGAVRRIADGLGPDVDRGAPIHPAIIRDALYARADRIESGEIE